MKIALVFCPFGGIEQPPAGITYLAAYLRDAHDVSLFDLNIHFRRYCAEQGDEFFSMDVYAPGAIRDEQHLELGELEVVQGFVELWASRIAGGYDLVGFSLFQASFHFSTLLMEAIRRLKPGIRIVAGGPFCDLTDGGIDVMELPNPADSGPRYLVDAAVLGEGELSFRGLVNTIEAGGEIHGLPGVLTSRSEKPPPVTPAEWADLDALPFPDYSGYELASYKNLILPLVASRGCPYNCRYCAEKPLWEIYRSRRAAGVFEEIRHHMRESGALFFHFSESLVNGNISMLHELCDRIIESKIEIGWYALATARKQMNDGLLQKIRASGCSSLNYGLESGSDRLLRDMRKPFTAKQVSAVLAATRRAGISTEVCLFVGYPTETEEDLAETFNFLERNAASIDRVHLAGTCRVGPRSYLMRHAGEMGIVGFGDEWHLTDGTSTPLIREDRARRLEAHCEKLGLKSW